MSTGLYIEAAIFVVFFQEKALPLREIISRLEKVYCGSIGAEFMHICNLDEVSLFFPERNVQRDILILKVDLLSAFLKKFLYMRSVKFSLRGPNHFDCFSDIY